jgi:hypothetical protein
MIEFSLGKKEYGIGDVSIEQYYKIVDFLVLTESVQAQYEIIHLLSGAPIEDLRKLGPGEFALLWNEVSRGPLGLDDNPPLVKSFYIENQCYAFLDLNKMTIGELADMDVLRQDPQRDKKLHLMMAILYRPAVEITKTWFKIEEYDSETLEARAELFKKMPIKNVMGAINFFFHFIKASYENILDSLALTSVEKEEKERLMEAKHLILNLLDSGQTSSIFFAEKTFSKWKELHVSLLQQLSTFSPTKRRKLVKLPWNKKK